MKLVCVNKHQIIEKEFNNAQNEIKTPLPHPEPWRNKHRAMAKNKQRRRGKCICEKQACKCRQNIRKGKAEEAIRDMTVGMVRAK